MRDAIDALEIFEVILPSLLLVHLSKSPVKGLQNFSGSYMQMQVYILITLLLFS